MSKHTKGPWSKNRYGELKDPNGKDIGVWGFGVSHVTRSEEAEANAVLLETAPELLEALEMLVLFTNPKPSNASALANAHRVIDKATSNSN